MEIYVRFLRNCSSSVLYPRRSSLRMFELMRGDVGRCVIHSSHSYLLLLNLSLMTTVLVWFVFTLLTLLFNIFTPQTHQQTSLEPLTSTLCGDPQWAFHTAPTILNRSCRFVVDLVWLVARLPLSWSVALLGWVGCRPSCHPLSGLPKRSRSATGWYELGTHFRLPFTRDPI